MKKSAENKSSVILKRRRPKGFKFLADYYKIKDIIENDGVYEQYVEEDGRMEYDKFRRITKNRHLFTLFEYFGRNKINKNELKRIENISNNKIRILHDQILSRNFILILDNFVSTLLGYKISKVDYELMRSDYPWSALKKKQDYDFFDRTYGQEDDENVVKKYAKLSKILGKLPDNEDFVKIAGISKRLFSSIKNTEYFSEEFQIMVLSWRYPKKEILKRKTDKNYVMKENKKTSKATKELINKIISEWQSFTEIKLNNESIGTKDFNDTFISEHHDRRTRIPNYDKEDWDKIKHR